MPNSPSHRPRSFLHFWKNCVIELFSLDLAAAYPVAFVYIRQLAVHLRQAFGQRQPALVTTWTFLHSLKVWVKLVSRHGRAEPLSLLLHPLVQVIQGVTMLVPGSRFAPLRLHCTQFLLDLVQSTSSNSRPPVFVAVAAPLLELLSDAWATGSTRTGKLTSRPLNFFHLLLAPEKLQQEHSFAVMLLQQVHIQLVQYLASFCRSPAFPELLLPVMVAVRRFVKESRIHEAVQRFRVLVDRASQTSKIIEAERALLAFGPGSAQETQLILRREGLGALPLETYLKEAFKAQENLRTIATKAYAPSVADLNEEKDRPGERLDSEDVELDGLPGTRDRLAPLASGFFSAQSGLRDDRSDK